MLYSHNLCKSSHAGAWLKPDLKPVRHSYLLHCTAICMMAMRCHCGYTAVTVAVLQPILCACSLLQADKKYHPGWVWHMLKARWGDEAVTSYCNAMAAEQLAAQQQVSRRAKAAEQVASQQQAHRRLRSSWTLPARRRALQFA